MTVTIDQRLTELEKDCSRILEALQDIAVVSNGDEYNDTEEGELLDLKRRVSRAEYVLESLAYKAAIIKGRG